MNSQIETWRVVAFGENVLHLSQQEGSRLEMLCRRDSFIGKQKFYDRLGEATAETKVGRNVDTPNLNIDHSRRSLTTAIKHWGTLVDSKDKLQNIHNPGDEYAKAAAMAIGREVDNTVISKALGTNYAGESGATATVLGHLQRITSVASSAIAVPNIQLLRKAKRKMDAANVRGSRVIVHAADFLEALLSTTEVGSFDYNAVKSLVNGELNTFMGFKFVHCEEMANSDYLADTLDDTAVADGGTQFKYDTSTGLYSASGTALGATDLSALCFVENSAVILGENTGGRKFRVEEAGEKCFDQRIYTARDMGACRIEEAQVLHLVYKAA